MIDKLIYSEEHPEPYKADTWVVQIGEGHYAINQSRGSKNTQELVYLTRQQIEQILKEDVVKE